MPAAPRVRRAGRRARGDLRDVALRRVGRAARRTSAWRTCSGSRSAARADGPMQNAYLRLEDDPRTGRRHPLLAGLDDAPRIIHGTWRLDVTPSGRVRRPAADAHPELSRPADGEGLPARPEDRHRRGVPARGRARAASSISPGTSTASSGRSWASTTACCSRNAVRWATDEEPPVEVKGPGVLDVTAWRQEGSMTVHLVNLTNPMMMKGPFRELIPVGEQRVTVRLPGGREGPTGPAPGGGARGARRAGRHAAERDGAVGPGPRGRGDRSLKCSPIVGSVFSERNLRSFRTLLQEVAA